MFANAKKNKLGELGSKNKYSRTDYKVDLNNDNDTHAAVCNAVLNNSIVLDIGFGQAAISRCLKEEKNCEIDGIEVDEIAIKEAEKLNIFTKIYKQKSTKIKLKKEYYDYIIFADVLEHLYNPLETIESCLNSLKESGNIIISLPNISYYDIIAGLINNKFNYDLMGLLDNTHIRFFTSKSFYEYIEYFNNKDTGTYLDCELLKEIKFNPEFFNKYKNLDKLLSDVPHILNYQIVFKLTKKRKKEDTVNLSKLIQEDIDYLDIIDKKLNERI